MKRRFPIALSALLLPTTLVFAANEVTTPLPAVIVTGEQAAPANTAVTQLPRDAASLTETPETVSLTDRAPNFSISDATQHSLGAVYAIRGLTNTIFFSSQAVGMLQDGVPFGDSFTFATPLYDVDSVDILRGPQPDRFGLNTEAGLISIHTHQADPQAWHGEGSASYGSYDTQEYRLSLGGPLIKDKLTLELGGYWGLSSGYVNNDFLDLHRDTRDTLSGRAVLTWTPSPDWKISAGVEATRSNDGSQRLVSLEGDPFRVTSNTEGGLDLHQQREWLDITKKFETWQVRSITGHMGYEANPAVLDLDLTPARADVSGVIPGILPVAPGAVSTIRRTQDEWSTELRFESLPKPDNTSIDYGKDKDGKKAVAPITPADPFKWVAGLFYQRKDTSEDDTRAFSAPFVTAVPFGPVLAPITVYTPLAQTTQFHIVEEQFAGYANAGYTLGKFEIDAGIRLDYDRKTFYRDKTDNLGSLPLQLNGQHDDWTVAGSLGGTYHVTDDLSAFVRSSYGFKPGGFSGYTDDPKLAEFSRETDWSNEIGLRAKALDGKVNAELVGYYNMINNYQVERTFSFTDYLVVDANRAESLGVEFSASWEIVHGLAVSGNIGYNQTQLLGYHDPLTGANLSGNEAPYVPEFTALAAIDYAHDCGFRAHVEVVGVGETQFTDTNDAHFRQSPYALVNARVGYERKNWGAYVFGRNLSDTKYFLQKSSDLDAGVIGEPCVVGVMGLLRF